MVTKPSLAIANGRCGFDQDAPSSIRSALSLADPNLDVTAQPVRRSPADVFHGTLVISRNLRAQRFAGSQWCRLRPPGSAAPTSPLLPWTALPPASNRPTLLSLR